MDYDNLKKSLAGEPVWRLAQAEQAVFRGLIEDWSAATALSQEARKKLTAACPLEIKAEVLAAADNRSAKAVIVLADGVKIETVLMRHEGRNTICVSSQAGCALGCVFCATGARGFQRNLTAAEILEQVLFWGRWLKNSELAARIAPLQRDCRKGGFINNVVFMGMGEPFLNYGEVMEAIKIINDKDAFNIGSRHISVSTVGIIPGIEKFSEEPLQTNLAISLHAPSDKLRSRLMPIDKKYPIGAVLAAVGGYIKKTNRKVMFEYVMIKDINDSDDCARELIKILKIFPGRLIMANLIVYNPTGVFWPSLPERVKRFKNILIKGGLQAIERYRFGGDIAGACGQLAAGGGRKPKN